MRPLTLFTAAIIVCAGSSAWAAPITLSTFVGQTIGTSPQPHGCGSTSTTQTLNETCAGSADIPGFGTADGHFSATAALSASLVQGLEFHASSDLSAWVDNNEGTARTLTQLYAASLASRILLEDTIAIRNTGTETMGFLRFEFDITGSVITSEDANTLDGFNPVTGVNAANAFGTGSGAVAINGVSAGFGGNRHVVLDVPYAFDVFELLSLVFNVTAIGQIGATYQGVRVNADFSNTVTLVSTSVLDSNKNPLPAATVESAGAIDYRAGAAAVPEPASLLLLAVGFAAVSSVRRRHRSARA